MPSSNTSPTNIFILLLRAITIKKNINFVFPRFATKLRTFVKIHIKRSKILINTFYVFWNLFEVNVLLLYFLVFFLVNRNMVETNIKYPSFHVFFFWKMNQLLSGYVLLYRQNCKATLIFFYVSIFMFRSKIFIILFRKSSSNKKICVISRFSFLKIISVLPENKRPTIIVLFLTYFFFSLIQSFFYRKNFTKLTLSFSLPKTLQICLTFE